MQEPTTYGAFMVGLIGKQAGYISLWIEDEPFVRTWLEHQAEKVLIF